MGHGPLRLLRFLESREEVPSFKNYSPRIPCLTFAAAISRDPSKFPSTFTPPAARARFCAADDRSGVKERAIEHTRAYVTARHRVIAIVLWSSRTPLVAARAATRHDITLRLNALHRVSAGLVGIAIAQRDQSTVQTPEPYIIRHRRGEVIQEREACYIKVRASGSVARCDEAGQVQSVQYSVPCSRLEARVTTSKSSNISRLTVDGMSNLGEVDPFSEMPLELPVEEEPDGEGDDEAIVEEGPKNNVEINTVSKVAYAEPLTPEEIQWFYKDGVDKRWNKFCGYDSLRIERIYRERQSLISESNDGTNGLPPAGKIVVRGGMYDVDIDNMKCVSIYWPGEEWKIMRGTWYYDGSWIPLETEHSKVIEEVHLKLFQKDSNNQSITTCNTSTPQSYKVLHTEQFPEFHVDWHSVNDVTQYSEYTPTKLMRSVTSKLGFAKTIGYRLKRGYKTRTSMEDKPRDIDHLVFVVHGIGQKRDTGKIIRNTTCFRDCVDWLKQKYFPNSKHRVEFFPVEWRSSLKLDGDIVDAITPYSVLSIRHLLNTSAMDILYYTSPLYGGEVRAGLQKELNRLYFMFASRHPGWQGKVSILAHSLGCVIVYDIVTGLVEPETRLPCPQAQEVLLQGLQFPIENLFCLGSPLSVFLALRTRTPSNRLDVMPQSLCKRFYNIFHWSDPVAYRMEPLLERCYSKIEPVLIPPYGGVDGQQMPQSPSSLNNVDPEPPTETDDKDDSPVDSPPIRNAEKGWSLWDLVRGGWNVREGPSSPTPDSNPPIRPGQELAQRLDYVLRAVGLGRNYLYTVTAHTAYWNNYDVAYFVLTRLFPTLET